MVGVRDRVKNEIWEEVAGKGGLGLPGLCHVSATMA